MKTVGLLLIMFIALIILQSGTGGMLFQTADVDTIYVEYIDAFKMHADSMYNVPVYTDISFKDSAVSISGGTKIQITNTYDSLFHYYAMSGVGYKKGDTILITYTGAYLIFGSISGTGGNGADWSAQYAFKRGPTITYGKYELPFTTTGATNKNGASGTAFQLLNAGDKLFFVLSRTSGSGDFTINGAKFSPILLFRI